MPPVARATRALAVVRRGLDADARCVRREAERLRARILRHGLDDRAEGRADVLRVAGHGVVVEVDAVRREHLRLAVKRDRGAELLQEHVRDHRGREQPASHALGWHRRDAYARVFPGRDDLVLHAIDRDAEQLRTLVPDAVARLDADLAGDAGEERILDADAQIGRMALVHDGTAARGLRPVALTLSAAGSAGGFLARVCVVPALARDRVQLVHERAKLQLELRGVHALVGRLTSSVCSDTPTGMFGAYDTNDSSSLVPVELPGFLGARKAERFARWDDWWGRGRWTLAHLYRDRFCVGETAFALYEQSYRVHFERHPEVLEALVANASEVYDTSPSNIASGFDWSAQDDGPTHLQDIAVRRAVRALGRSFRGSRPLEIRGRDSEGYHLNPGQIPFFDPDAILRPATCRADWIRPDSLEDFWQQNKVLLVERQALIESEERLRVELAKGRRARKTAISSWLVASWLDGRWVAGSPRAAFERLIALGEEDQSPYILGRWIGRALAVLSVRRAVVDDDDWFWARVGELGGIADLAASGRTHAPIVTYAPGDGTTAALRAAAAALFFPRLSAPVLAWPESSNIEGRERCASFAVDADAQYVLRDSRARSVIRASYAVDTSRLPALRAWARILANKPADQGADCFAATWVEPFVASALDT